MQDLTEPHTVGEQDAACGQCKRQLREQRQARAECPHVRPTDASYRGCANDECGRQDHQQKQPDIDALAQNHDEAKREIQNLRHVAFANGNSSLPDVHAASVVGFGFLRNPPNARYSETERLPAIENANLTFCGSADGDQKASTRAAMISMAAEPETKATRSRA